MLFSNITISEGKMNKNKILDDLIIKFSNYDTEAMEEFYAMTKTSIYGFALSIVKNHHKAEDIMQDSYIKIFENASRYVSQNKPMAWILTIVKNLSLSTLDHTSQKEFDLEEDRVSRDRALSDSIVDKVFIEEVLTYLTREEGQIIVLNAVVGMKHREIATLLRLPLSTSLSKYYRALSKLRKLLKEEAD